MNFLRNTIIKLVVALAILPFVSCTAHNSSEPQKPNIIVFFADDMAYADLSCYGNPNIRTPHIDKLAEEGLKLTSFYVAGPVCTPSRAALMSGRYPIHTLPGNLGPNSKNGFPSEELIIPEVLKTAGYKSMAIGKWHLGHATKELMPTGKGFDKFYGLPYSNDMIKPWVDTDVPLKLYIDDKAVKTVDYDQESLTNDFTTEAIKFINETKDQPFFLYVPYSMPHLPISTNDQFKGTSEGGLYGDVIENIDWSVGEIMNALKAANIDDNTLIVFTSDNGPWHELPDRMLAKGVEPWHQGTTGPLRGSKASTYEGGMRVPGIFYWKNEIPAGQVSSDIVTTMDIFPTLLEIAGIKKPANKEFDGVNILPFLKREAKSPRTEFFYLKGKTIEAVREGEWKLRYSNERREDAGLTLYDPIEMELYNMKHDVGEKHNVAELYPEIAERLMNKMKAKAKEINARISKPKKQPKKK
ncbi:sulfatase [Labilibacter sediminis]|nr:sulfatase [Labilibacter sediminis]